MFDPHEEAAKRISSGQPVGEGFLYGVGAVEIVRRRLLNEGALEAARHGAFEARVKAYGRQSADDWKKERIAWHRLIAETYDAVKAQRRAKEEDRRQ